jgi:formyltetrahydrofolate deformylase
MKQFATITVIGRDKTGVIARVTNFLFEQHANIEALEEQVTRGQFSMTLQASWRPADCNAASLRAGLDALARRLGMEIKVRFTDPTAASASPSWSRRKRIASTRSWPRTKFKADPVLVIQLRRPRAARAKKQIAVCAHSVERPRAGRGRALRLLEEHQIDFIVLARFMKILSPNFVWRYKNKIINIHPSLLPSFPGPQAYRQAYEQGVKIAGVTAHFVSMRLDEGPIIAQGSFPSARHGAQGTRRARPATRSRRARQGRETLSRQTAGRLLGRGEGGLTPRQRRFGTN